jgi:two-component system chemotaxis response regulator CheB
LRHPRVLIVDDSVVVRRDLTAALSQRPGIEIAGAASSGRIALMKIPLLHPDVVALDVEMIDALETLAAIRANWRRLKVIVLNVPTVSGASATADALARGASDFVMKPAAAVPSEKAMSGLAEELASKIASCCQIGPGQQLLQGAVRRGWSIGSADRHRIDVVVIGTSTGGPSALTDLIPAFDADFPVPILIVQHLPPVFTKLLAERLSAQARIRVAEGGHHQALTPGCAWIAPGDFHMAVERDGGQVRIVTHRQPPENSCRPAADVLFRSVAKVYGPHALAVVMTGMGQDGFRGCEEIQAAGGQVLVQDEESSVVWGMPGFVARAGIADGIVPLTRLSTEILDRVQRGRHELVAPGRSRTRA